jgi:hypothetical protein
MERRFFLKSPEFDLDKALATRRAIVEGRDQMRRYIDDEPEPKGFDRWLWSTELFPYPGWELRKLSLYHPLEVSDFFEAYRPVMRRLLSLESRKEFFNYCKVVIASTQVSPPAIHDMIKTLGRNCLTQTKLRAEPGDGRNVT